MTQRQNRLTEREAAELVELYVAGVSVVQLAAKFSVHKTTVSGHLERAGVSRRGSVRVLSTEQVAEASVLYLEGMSLKSLGERFGVSHSTVRNALARVGVEIRGQGRRGCQP